MLRLKVLPLSLFKHQKRYNYLNKMKLLSSSSLLLSTSTTTRNNNSNSKNKSKIDNEESWLSKHSGKVGIVALSISITLIYRYFKSMTMRTDQEKLIANEEAIEPYEYNELKHNNNIPISLYNDIAKSIIQTYDNRLLSYNDFIKYVIEYITKEEQKYGINKLRSCHLLDRIVFKHLAINDNNNNDKDKLYQELIDLNFLLIALNITVKGLAEERIESLFAIINDNNDINTNNMNNNSNISKEKVELLLKHLIDSCQIPSEKQVIETGVSYPLITYRKKTPSEIIKSYCDINKYHKNTFDINELQELLLSGTVCAWGECYRERNR